MGVHRAWSGRAALAALALLAACSSAPHRADLAGGAVVPAPAASATPGGAVGAPVTVLPQRGWDDAVLYFVMLDRWADGDPDNNQDVDRTGKGTFHGGDLAGLIANLDEIADLGCTALWITPVVQQIPGFVSGAGFPDWGYHGYWADDFNAIDPRFGTEEQLAELVRESHARGLKVLLDVVYNHCGYDARYVRERGRAWLRIGAECGDDDLTLCLSGLPDFKTEKPEVSEYLLAAHLGLAARTGLDGFRLDTVKHVEHDFWDLHRARTRAELGHDFFLIGEVWGGDERSLDPWFEPDQMDAGLDFGFQGSAVGFVMGRGRPVAFNRYLDQRERVRPGYLLSHYLSSHDTDGALHTLDGDRAGFMLCVALQMTARGIPCIYYGEEVGRRIGTWPDNRTPMPWGDRGVLPGAGIARDEDLRAHYQRLIAIRRAHPSLWRGERRGLDFGSDHLVFQRHDPASGDHLIVAVNRGAAPAVAAVPSPAGWTTGAVDLIGGAVQPSDGQVLTITMPARSALILGPAAAPR